MNDYELAIRSIKKAIRVAPFNAMVWYGIIRVLFRTISLYVFGGFDIKTSLGEAFRYHQYIEIKKMSKRPKFRVGGD